MPGIGLSTVTVPPPAVMPPVWNVRMATMRELGTAMGPVRSRDDVLDAVERTLGDNDRDLPFSLVYLLDEDAAEVIERTYAAYGHMDGWELRAISHLPGSPWATVDEQEKFGPIPDALTERYYREQLRVANTLPHMD